VTDSTPLVSIGMPVYNSEKWLPPTLDSLLHQTYPYLEIVICDNASTDNTGAICQAYAGQDQRIRYHRNAKNMGGPYNFRRVFDLSRGEYFMWVAADDVRPSTAVESLVTALLRNDRAVMAHGPVLVQVEGREGLQEVMNNMRLSDTRGAARIQSFTQGIKHRAMLFGLYRQWALARVTYKDGYGPDYLLCLQMCLLGPIEYVQTPMIVYYERVPSGGAMPAASPLTLIKLLTPGRGWRKHWIVLLMGCYFLLRVHGTSLPQRLACVVAHAVSFSRLYRVQLAKGTVHLVFWPAACLISITWWLARRWSVSLHFARRLKALVARI
jgi:glycosyltransferase involved in cell wall biosynthesis